MLACTAIPAKRMIMQTDDAGHGTDSAEGSSRPTGTHPVD